MNHLSRLISMLTLLQSKRIVTGTELAERFDVSVRTIYRDIRKLEESGVPVITIEGRGYTIMDGYRMAPVMFDEMEVNALVTAEQIIAKTNDDSLIRHFDQTLRKIKSVFKGSLLNHAEMLNSKMHIRKNIDEEVKSTSLSYIQMAIVNFRLVDFSYEDKNKQATSRKVEPLAILSVDEKWLVIGWCRLREALRVFRLDRIHSFRILEETFPDRNFDLAEFFASCGDFESYP